MTSRIRLLVAACLCAASSIAEPALAQVEIPLRASYQGAFLPEGTEIIVLTEPGRHVRDGRYQPEFFPARDFPRTSSSTPRRDRLDATGHSNRSYAATQASGRLYFIYALTPDSTLYWSYSALRDSLKYDVVSTGVMSVAPVASAEVRDAVMATFFRPRVRVIMKGEAEEDLRMEGRAVVETGSADVMRGDRVDMVLESTKQEDADRHAKNASDGDERSTERLSVRAASGAGAEPSTPEIDPQPSRLEPTAAQSDVASIASSSQTFRAEGAGITLPPLLAWGLLLLVLAAVGVPVYLVREARSELRQVRREMIALRGRMAADATSPADDELTGTTEQWTGQGDRHDPHPDFPWK